MSSAPDVPDPGGSAAGVSVVVVLHNSTETLADCLASMPSDVEVIVVDNASTDDGAALAERFLPGATVVRSERNLGFGGGCNLGLREATRDVVVFVNPDAVLTAEAEFQEGVEDLKDLQPGMILEGVVTNVTNFGAFVDIGVHQDGLVHISALSEKFIKDPREAVKAGDVVKVKVMEVDIPRKRVGLSMRMSDTPGEKVDGARGARPGAAPRQSQNTAPRKETATAAPANNAMASLFANAKQLKKR